MIRPTIDALPASRIREVANAGIGRVEMRLPATGRKAGEQVTAILRPADFSLGSTGIPGTVSRAVVIGAAFSVITNLAAGMTGAELSHGETKENAPRGGKILGELIAASLKEISR